MKNRPERFSALFLICIGLLSLSLISFQWACAGNQNNSAAHEEHTLDPDADHMEHADSHSVVRFTDTQMKEFGIETGPAASGILPVEAVLPGEVVLNADRLAHVVPRVSGVVREVHKNLGDSVQQGEVMAVLESRELADSTATLLAARESVFLAENNYAREEQLWRKKISPEQDFIEAKNKLAEANIELQTAELKLMALGFSREFISQIAGRRDEDIILYRITAPFNGTVMEKHISIGEVLKDDSAAFLIADLSTVWVNLDVQQKDLPLIKVGQTAAIGIGTETSGISGRVNFLEPIATETNRTIHARVVVPNADGLLRPGLFVTGRILVDRVHVPVLVPNDSLVLVENTMCVFVKQDEGFRPQSVTTGRADSGYTEITSGLVPGQLYATKGAFTLKSELQKPEAEHRH
jgi:cobalt-zinc-cadmium efflux system membrane fusion protein